MRRILQLVLTAALACAAPPHDLIPHIKLEDGRELKNFQIVSFASTAVMAKWEGGRGTVPYEKLPKHLRAAAEKQRPSASTSDSQAPSDQPRSPAQVVAGSITVGEINLRSIESSGGYVRYAWTANILNGLNEPRRLRTHIRLLDAKGFELDSSMSDSELVLAQQATLVSGKSLVKEHVWAQVKSYKVGIR